jgi:ferric-dicitrate binding protein FerR (iron transport regulator)
MTWKAVPKSLFNPVGIPPELVDGAVRWLIWLRSDAADDRDAVAFAHWCARSGEHERAAREVIHFWSLLAMAIHPDCDDPLAS